MEYIDETIVAMRRHEKSTNRSRRICLADGIDIYGKHYVFQQNTYDNGYCSLMLPITFDQMPEEQARITYPSEQRPKFIRCSETISEGFTLCVLDEIYEASALPNVLIGIQKSIQNIQPSNLFYDRGTVKADSISAWIDFKSFTLNEPIYNILFLSLVGSKVLMGTFYCLFDQYEEWKPAALTVIKTISKIKEKDKN